MIDQWQQCRNIQVEEITEIQMNRSAVEGRTVLIIVLCHEANEEEARYDEEYN